MAANVSELPQDIQKKLHSSKFKEEDLNQNFDTLLAVLRFVTKDAYQKPDGPAGKHSEHTPYASPELVKKSGNQHSSRRHN